MSDALTQIASARAARESGDSYEAALHQRRAIALLRGGETVVLGDAIRQLVEILIEGGLAEDAATPAAEVLALYQAHPDVPPIARADALRCAALQASATGDDETAIVFWAEALTRYAALGMIDQVAEAEARIAALR